MYRPGNGGALQTVVREPTVEAICSAIRTQKLSPGGKGFGPPTYVTRISRLVEPKITVKSEATSLDEFTSRSDERPDTESGLSSKDKLNVSPASSCALESALTLVTQRNAVPFALLLNTSGKMSSTGEMFELPRRMTGALGICGGKGACAHA